MTMTTGGYAAAVDAPVAAGCSSVSFAELYEQAHQTLLPMLRRRVGTAADDVFHDTMLTVFEQWEYVTTVENPIGWTRTVASRLANRRSLRESRRPSIESSYGFQGSDSVDQSHRIDLLEALSALRPDHAAAFRLTQVDDLDPRAAADYLGVAEATVKVWVHRGRQRLAEQTTGVRGRWTCETDVTPAMLERTLVDRGHGRYVDDAMPCLVDRPVRWQIEIDRGKFRLSTTDGEQMDQGDIRVRIDEVALRSVRLAPRDPRVIYPTEQVDIGTSLHRLDVDGDRLRLRITATDIPPTNGVPDRVFRELFFDNVAYRWAGTVRTW